MGTALPSCTRGSVRSLATFVHRAQADGSMNTLGRELLGHRRNEFRIPVKGIEELGSSSGTENMGPGVCYHLLEELS